MIGEKNEIKRSQRKKAIVVRGIEGTIEREEIREAVEKILGQGSIVGIDEHNRYRYTGAESRSKNGNV